MYEYKFVRLAVKGWIELKPVQDHHEVIEDHARNGWRLVQVLTPPTGIHGSAPYFELIFERPSEY